MPRSLVLALSVFLTLATTAEAQQAITLVPTIMTVAGTGGRGYSGDGGPAISAATGPVKVVVDAAGNLYIADYINQVIRKVDTNGIITTVAGNGTIGYSGDDGAATQAQLNYPSDVAVDASGNVYIADNLNGLIRKVDTNGIITTIAGIPNSPGYSGDNGPAVSAQLVLPSALTLDTFGNLYVTAFYARDSRRFCTNNHGMQ